MTVIDRDAVRLKTGGRCAYCGEPLESIFHVDHVLPKYLGGSDEESNLLPACPRCNLWKASYSVGEFREEIVAQWGRLQRDSAGFRLAVDMNQIYKSAHPLVFYFELTEGHNP